MSQGGLTAAAKNAIISSAVNNVPSVNYASSALIASGLIDEVKAGVA